LQGKTPLLNPPAQGFGLLVSELTGRKKTADNSNAKDANKKKNLPRIPESFMKPFEHEQSRLSNRCHETGIWST
jgi:hypothetical protein